MEPINAILVDLRTGAVRTWAVLTPYEIKIRNEWLEATGEPFEWMRA